MVSKWCNATFLQICSHEEANSSTSCMARGWVHFSAIFIFGWTIPLSSIAENFWLQQLRKLNMHFCSWLPGLPATLNKTLSVCQRLDGTNLANVSNPTTSSYSCTHFINPQACKHYCVCRHTDAHKFRKLAYSQQTANF